MTYRHADQAQAQERAQEARLAAADPEGATRPRRPQKAIHVYSAELPRRSWRLGVWLRGALRTALQAQIRQSPCPQALLRAAREVFPRHERAVQV